MDEIQQAIDEIVSASSTEYDRFEMEAYIRRAVACFEMNVSIVLFQKAQTPQQEAWARQRHDHLAIVMAHALEVVLRKELLPDAEK